MIEGGKGGGLNKGRKTTKIKVQMTHIKELCKQMEIEIIGTAKKLLSCADSLQLKLEEL